MSRIDCDKDKAAARHFQLAVVGGGIHGVMLALEASLRGINTLLLEQADFGGATSFNSLRIIHGGFRYAQHFDFRRLIASARERQWFLRFFPEFAAPLACLMPLYGRGLRRPMILGAALKGYQLLTERFNRELAPSQKIPAGRIISAAETAESSCWIIRKDLRGGAVWHDAFMPDSHRILIGALRWACDHGAAAINYCRAEELLTHQGRVVGVRAGDPSSGECHEFRADSVINAAGPWCRQVAARFDRDVPRLFNTMAAWNVLFDRPAVSPYALAISPPYAGGRTYFIVPWKGQVLAGTGQASWAPNRSKAPVSEKEIDDFCRDLNLALPSLELRKDEIIHVYSGLQSAKRPGGSDFAHRDVVVDHAQSGGPRGLFSISGIKFTTARLVAERALNMMFPRRKHVFSGGATSFYQPPPDVAETHMLFEPGWRPPAAGDAWSRPLRALIDQEAVRHLDDLVVRRSNLGDNPERAVETAGRLCEIFDWGESQRKAEIQRLQDSFPFYTPGVRMDAHTTKFN